MAIAGLLLCGGAARRFGGRKLLAGDGPIVADAARALLAGVGHALAIISPGDAQLREVLEREGLEILEADRTPRGMGATLAAGVEATPSASGWIVALGDMPRVSARTIAQVKDALGQGAMLAAPFDAQGRRGHPVGFSSSLLAELLALDGDVGARDIVRRHAASLVRIVTDDAGIFIDIDTPSDLIKAVKNESSTPSDLIKAVKNESRE